ncbi:MAG: hypothetical protein LEGION0398_MBIBDBAK_01093 [Legionellaceae bacterium]
MQLSLNTNNGQYYIKAFAPGEIIINEKTYKKSIIISPIKIIDDWLPQSLDEIKLSDLGIIETLKPDIVLLGTQKKTYFSRQDIIAFFYAKNIGIEIMNTNVACRTFNVLASEGRNIVAGLMLD